MTDQNDRFAKEVRAWVEAHASQNSGSTTPESMLAMLQARLPTEVLQAIGVGLIEGYLCTTRGYWAGPPVVAPEKVSQAQYVLTNSGTPPVSSPCWEVFVQLAEYVRLRSALSGTGLGLKLEDRLMDITISDGTALLGYVELKVDGRTASALVEKLRKYGKQGVDLSRHDRKDDAHKKAKYIAEHRPKYFAVRAIGHEEAFEVIYEADNKFDLINPEKHTHIDAYLRGRRTGAQTPPRDPVGQLHVALGEACPALDAGVVSGQSRYNFYLDHRGADEILIGVYNDGSVWSDLKNFTPGERSMLADRLSSIGVTLNPEKQWTFWTAGANRANLSSLDVYEIANALRLFLNDLATPAQ